MKPVPQTSARTPWNCQAAVAGPSIFCMLYPSTSGLSRVIANLNSVCRVHARREREDGPNGSSVLTRGTTMHAPSSGAYGSDTLASFSLGDLQGCAVVTAAGEIDLCTSPGLHEALADAALRSERVIVDLSRVSFLDSTGMAVMVKALRE